MVQRKPTWASKKIDFRSMHETESRMHGLGIHTVCHQARCPNISECFSRGTATFLILGDTCTRGCGFCNMKRGTPQPADFDEPARIAEAVRRMKLRHVVVTSVTRDDLDDGGASIFAHVVKQVKMLDASITVEVLAPDFNANEASIRNVMDAGPDIFGHNIETVPSLYNVRRNCSYIRSLAVLGIVKKRNGMIRTKSALLLGLGETFHEIIEVLHDLRKVDCDYVSIGQYLQPGRMNVPVREYIKPEQFDKYKKAALDMGFLHAESGVYVRSSYLADAYMTYTHLYFGEKS